MTFSNVNIFRNTVVGLRASEPGATADRIVRGGAFSPDTKEAVTMMRSDVDNQWENSYIIKYQALMQNRLNRLKQDLTNSYKSILEVSSVQQIRENGLTTSNSAITDVYGKLLNNSGEAFKKLKYYNDEAEFLADDDNDNSSADGTPSYLLNTDLNQFGTSGDGTGVDATRRGVVEMRKMYVTGPALQIANSMKVAFRTEEAPPEYNNPQIPLIGGLIPGEKGFTPGQKVAEYSTDVKSGGFWTTLNYLYNFAPREMKYSYPTAYSTNTEEAGSRQIVIGDLNGDGDTTDNGERRQATIFMGEVTDSRDVYRPGTGAINFPDPFPDIIGRAVEGQKEDSTMPSYSADLDNIPPTGARIKWAETDANSGYQTERSPIIIQRDNNQNAYGQGTSRIMSPLDQRVITRRESDNDSVFDLNLISRADSVIKTYDNFPNGSPRKVTIYGTEDSNGSFSGVDTRIKWEYNHDGKGSGDFDQDGLEGDNSNGTSNTEGTFSGSPSPGGGAVRDDQHVTKAIFVNHYTVQTQEVELNSSVESYGGIKALEYNSVTNDLNYKQKTYRSAGIDGSLEHVFSDQNKNTILDGVYNMDLNGDGDTSDEGEEIREKTLVAGSSKVSKNFDGKFVSGLYKLSTFNGQNIATENANVNITTKNDADKVVIAEYEGFKRAQVMNAGLADDLFSSITNTPRTLEEAQRLSKKIETEVNATSMVDTDWHYSEHVSSDRVMFKYIEDISYQSLSGGSDVASVIYKSNILDNSSVANGNFNNVNVGFRKTFKLEPKDFQQASYSAPFNSDIYINTPTYNDRDVWVDAITTNAMFDPATGKSGAELVVNGKLVTPTSTTTVGNQVTVRYNLKGFLQAGDNVIGAQAMFNGGTADDSFKLVPVTASNAADINSWLDGRVSTDNTKNGDLSVAKLNQATLPNELSSWQSKIMVRKAGNFTINDIITDPNTNANGTGGLDRAEFNTYFPDPKNPTAAQVANAQANSPLMLDYLSQYQKKYKNELNSLGSVETVTKVKDNNTFANMLANALNKKEYQDIYNLGLLNSVLGKTMVIKAQISAPTGGSVNATMDIQYDPISCKFILVQNKFDASGGV